MSARLGWAVLGKRFETGPQDWTLWLEQLPAHARGAAVGRTCDKVV